MRAGAALRDPARVLACAAAAACAGVAAFVALHHPLAPQLVLPATLVWSAFVFVRPAAWLFTLPALLPVVDLAPWTGWLTAEEFDFVVLGAAAGGYAAVAWRGAPGGDRTPRLSGTAVVAIALYALSTAASLIRGLALAGTPDFGWFEGYYSAQNSLRIAKGFGFALLLLPLLRLEWRRSSAHATGLLASGLAAGLGVAALFVVWERAAFPGILNFSSDYRVTGSFWEMHVGGAALDGFLVLAAPFAIWEFLHESRRLRWELAGGLLLLAGYACLATFSRGVYLALPLSLGLLAVLLLRRDAPSAADAARLFVRGCAAVALTAIAAFAVFRAGGYRSLLAALGVLALTLPLRGVARALSGRRLVVALACGAGAGAAGALAAPFVAKGPYVLYTLAFVATAAAVVHARRAPAEPRRASVAVAAYAALVVSAAAVARGWGGPAALWDSALVLGLLALLLIRHARAAIPPWPDGLAAQGAVVGAAALIGIATAVFGGGAYMTGRFTSSERDLDERLAHWRRVVRLLDTPADAVLGKGLGRFPESYLWGDPGGEFPGSYRMAERDGRRFLVLSGPTHETGFGEVLRIGQRLHDTPAGQYAVMLDARAPAGAILHVELCNRNVLYESACGVATASVGRSGSGWERSIVALDGSSLTRGPWYAPRPAFFAVAVDSPNRVIEIDNVSLVGPGGRNLLANGDFAADLARWFPTSDRFHLPWHAKNIALNVLFDQGVLGLLAFALLAGAALGRVAVGRARGAPLAPYLAASLAGFLVVGLFDSLIDAPRLAFVFFLLVLASLSLPAPSAASADGPRSAFL